MKDDALYAINALSTTIVHDLMRLRVELVSHAKGVLLRLL